MTEAFHAESWKFFVDTGGTFTDCLGLSPNDELIRAKVLSRGSLSAHALEISGNKKVLSLIHI